MSRCTLFQLDEDRTVRKRKLKRALVVVTVLAATALYAVAPVSYAACAAMALSPAPANCQLQMEMDHGAATQASVKCLALLHGLDANSASQPSALTNPQFHFVALVPPPSVLAAPVFVPRLRLTKPPPLRSPVPLTIRYSVFLK